MLINPKIDYRLTINGVDRTNLVQRASGGYNAVSLPGTGLSIVTSQIILAQRDYTIEFDDRFSTDFQRGSRIEISSDNEPLPAIGTQYIVSTNYDMKSTLDISATCVLGMTNFFTAGNLGVCFNFGEEQGVGDICRDLIVAAGVPSGQIDLGSFNRLNQFIITEPFRVGDGESLISAAGKIAGQHGCVMYQNSEGIVKMNFVIDPTEYLHVSDREETYIFSRNTTGESLVRKINFNFNRTSVASLVGNDVTSLTSGDTTVEVENTTDQVLRKTDTIIREYRNTLGSPLNLVTTSNVTKTYETSPNLVQRTGQVENISLCFPDDPARILTEVRTVEVDNTEVLKAWLSAQNTATVPSSFSVSGTITSERTEITHSYSDNLIIVVTDVFQAAAIAVPILGDLTLGRGSGTPITDVDPESLVISTKTIQQYYKSNTDANQWISNTSVLSNRFINNPEDLNLRVPDSAVPLQDIANDLFDLVLISNDTSYNVSEPTFETYQVNVEIAKTPDSFVVGSDDSAIPFTVVDDIVLGDYGNFNEEYMSEYGQELLALKNGRIYGMRVAIPLHYLPVAEWSRVSPLSRSKIIEPASIRQDIGTVYRIDALTISLEGDKAIAGYNGIFEGISNDPFNGSFFTDDIVYPQTLPSPVALAVLDLPQLELPLQVTGTFFIT